MHSNLRLFEDCFDALILNSPKKMSTLYLFCALYKSLIALYHILEYIYKINVYFCTFADMCTCR